MNVKEKGAEPLHCYNDATIILSNMKKKSISNFARKAKSIPHATDAATVSQLHDCLLDSCHSTKHSALFRIKYQFSSWL